MVGVGVGSMASGVLTVVVVVEQRGGREAALTVVVVSDELAGDTGYTLCHALPHQGNLEQLEHILGKTL